MADTQIELGPNAVGRFQSGMSLVLAATVGAIFSAPALASHSARIERVLVDWEVDRFRRDVEHDMNRGSFLEFEDHVLLEEIPHGNYREGAVCYFGSSPMKWAMMSWDLSAEQRKWIHNYGIGATSHELQAEFIRFLAADKGLLDAGEKTRVVLGAYWSMGFNWQAQGYFAPLLERYGLYTYDKQRGIHDAAMGGTERFVRLEKARCASLLKGIANRLARSVTIALGIALERTEKVRDPARVREWSSADRENWEKPLDAQMAALDELIRYIRERRAEVTVVLLPTRAPVRECPLPVAYRKRVRQLCEDNKIELVDLTELLAEDEYWDLNHSNYTGILKTHAALMEVATSHLRRVGLLP